jgi:hypothetical protein
MKYLLFLPFLAVLFFSSGCKKDETVTTPTTNTPASQELIATVNGTQWSANSVIINTAFSTLQIVGTNTSNASSIVLSIPSPAKKGDYDLGGFANTKIGSVTIGGEAFTTPFSTNINDTPTGKVTITDVTDTQVKGTFSFTAKSTSTTSTANVTNGRFTANLK